MARGSHYFCFSFSYSWFEWFSDCNYKTVDGQLENDELISHLYIDLSFLKLYIKSRVPTLIRSIYLN